MVYCCYTNNIYIYTYVYIVYQSWDLDLLSFSMAISLRNQKNMEVATIFKAYVWEGYVLGDPTTYGLIHGTNGTSFI